MHRATRRGTDHVHFHSRPTPLDCIWFVQLSNGEAFCCDLPPDLGLATAMVEFEYAPHTCVKIINMVVFLYS